jgi:hypothetical protein
MEDEGFIDDSFIDDLAREFVLLHGEGAIMMLLERARIASEAGDQLAAQAWQDMAEAAARLMEPDRDDGLRERLR